jgi:REP element-mobilizing transposase RayT
LFVQWLEDMRRRFSMCIYGYVVMPEHAHLQVNEPESVSFAEAIHYLKLSFAKRLRSPTGRSHPFPNWVSPLQKTTIAAKSTGRSPLLLQ